MQKTKWQVTRDLGATALLAVSIYAAGFVTIRMQFVDLHKSRTNINYFSQHLTMNPDGVLNKAISFYKPAFIAEAAFYKSDTVVINGWTMGMRMWNVPHL